MWGIELTIWYIYFINKSLEGKKQQRLNQIRNSSIKYFWLGFVKLYIIVIIRAGRYGLKVESPIFSHQTQIFFILTPKMTEIINSIAFIVNKIILPFQIMHLQAPLK